MGSCCGTKSNKVKDYSSHSVDHQNEHRHRKRNRSESDNDENRLPKVIFISEDTGLIYLDISSTEISKKLEYSLKRTFPNLVNCDHQKRIFHRIEMMKEKRFHIIIAGNIREDILRTMLNNHQIKGIYLIFIQSDHHLQHFKSSKIKGIYSNGTQLKKSVYHHIRYN